MSKKDNLQENPDSSLCFEEALSKLEGIVRELESGDLPLEKALAIFAEGVGLSQVCMNRLNMAEDVIDKILREEKGLLMEQPLTLGEDA